MKNIFLKFLYTFLFLLCLLGNTQALATQIVEYDIANANAAISNTVGIANIDANVTASDLISVGDLGLAYDKIGTFHYLDWPTGSPLDPSMYYTFSITPDAGVGIQYTDISLSVGSGGYLSAPEAANFELHASLDGFISNNIILTSETFLADATWHAFNFSAASLGTQYDTVEFRFYLYNITRATAFAGLGVNPVYGSNGGNLIVNGNIAPIPEPNTVFLFGFGLLGFVGLSRRKK